MNTTYLNPVKFAAGDKIVLTEEGRRSIRSFIKHSPGLGRIDAILEITKTVETMAEDEMTELMSETLGCTGLKDTKTGEEFNILVDDEILWAFLTDSTPHFFDKV